MLEEAQSCNLQLIIMGDFNLHVNNREDNDAQQFLDMLEASGLHQLVEFMTHKHSNILDLVIVESASDVKLSNLKKGPFLSDHRMVFGELNLPKPYILDKLVKYRNFRKANIEGLIDELCLNELCEMDCMLEEFWNKFQTRLKACLDKFVPEKTSKQPLRHSMPWFNQELRLMKCRIRHHEKVW